MIPNDPSSISFDFDSYLLNFTGRHWHIQELSGGHSIHTVRATSITEDLGESKRDGGYNRGHGSVDGHTSIVLKQAPPYFAKFPDMPFSQDRQQIEAKALALLHAPTLHGTATLCRVLHLNPSVRIPRLLHHDLSAFVLIQSDLGTLPNLDVFLTSPNTTPSFASSAGAFLGQFLRGLHAAFDDTPKVIKDELRQTFANDQGETILCEVIQNTIGFMSDAGVKDHMVLGNRAHENWTRRERTVFGQGDIWFGTILVCVEGGKVALGICDWEFAGFNHPAGDIGQLGSYLHLLSMSPLATPLTQTILQSFSSALYSSYFHQPHIPLCAEFQRSLVIMHAWEMINAAVWRHELWCSCPGTGVKCEHILEMVRVAARLLRAAGDGNTDEQINFVDWEALKDVYWCTYLKFE